MTLESDDSTLAREASRGNQNAYAQLVRRHRAALNQAARSFGIPETDIDDVVQESLIAAWHHLADYDPSRPFRAWLFRIALNKMRDLQRFRKVRHFLFAAIGFDRTESTALVDASPSPEQHSAARAELDRVVVTLGRLDSHLREALVLTALVGMSQTEAADTLGTTVKTIEGRVTRARAQLSGFLNEGNLRREP